MKVEFINGPHDGQVDDYTVPPEGPAEEVYRWHAGEMYLYRLEGPGMFPDEFRRYVYVPEAPAGVGAAA